MLNFTKSGFTVTVKTEHAPSEHWKNTVDDIIGCLQSESTDDCGGRDRFYILELLRAMMPDLANEVFTCSNDGGR